MLPLARKPSRGHSEVFCIDRIWEERTLSVLVFYHYYVSNIHLKACQMTKHAVNAFIIFMSKNNCTIVQNLNFDLPTQYY